MPLERLPPTRFASAMPLANKDAVSRVTIKVRLNWLMPSPSVKDSLLLVRVEANKFKSFAKKMQNDLIKGRSSGQVLKILQESGALFDHLFEMYLMLFRRHYSYRGLVLRKGYRKLLLVTPRGRKCV
jgi:hypothetical protein